jgi:hypothetical protein
MKSLRILLCGAGLSAALCGAAASAYAAHPATTHTLTLRITTSQGFTWGTVDLNYKNESCGFSNAHAKQGSCRFTVPSGTKITLTETPTSQYHSWRRWTLDKKKRSSNDTMTVKMSADHLVKALYEKT